MTHEEQVREILERWDALREQGKRLTAEELCADCPDLLDEVRRRMAPIQDMLSLLGGDEGVGTTDEDPVETPPPRLPEVPGYEVLGVLGEGGMGVVFKARHVKLNRVVALKMIQAGAE